jgi:PST family polysaccharide transporter
VSNLKIRTARGSIYMTAITFCIRPLSMGLAILLARLLTPEDFGVVALAMVVFVAANLFTDLGMRATVVQTKEDINKVAHYAFVLVMATSIAFTIFAMLVAEPLARLLGGSEGLADVIRWMSIYVAIDGLWIVPESLLRRDLRFKELGLSQLPGELASTIISIGLALLGFGMWSLVIGTCTGQLLRAALLWWYYRPWIWLRPQKWDRDVLRSMFKYGLPSMGSGLIRYAQGQIDTFVLGRQLGAASVGLYNKALNLTGRLGDMLTTSIFGNVLFPSYAKIQDDKPRLARAYLKSTKLVFLMIVPLSVGLAISAPLLVPVLLGPQWAPMIPIWQIFSLFGLLRPISTNAAPIFQAVGQPQRNLSAALVLMAFKLPLILLLVEPYGSIGVAVAVTLAALAGMLFNVFQVNQILPGTAFKTFSQSLPFFVAGGFMALGVWLLQEPIIALSGGENLLSLTLIILVAAVIYVVAILILQWALVLELYELLIKALGFDRRWPRLLPARLRQQAQTPK